jgi:hypothetical protein
MIRWLLIVALVCGAAYHYTKLKRPLELEQPPLVTVAAVTESRAPLQRDLNAGPVFRMNGYTLTALAEFSIGARDSVTAATVTSGGCSSSSGRLSLV